MCKCGGCRFFHLSLVKKMCKGTETIIVRDDRVEGLDIHSEEGMFPSPKRNSSKICSACFVSLTHVWRLQTRGAVILSRNTAIFPVKQLQAETIGRPGLPGLWILGRRQKLDVRGVVTTKLVADGGSSLLLIISTIIDFTCCWSSLIGLLPSFS